jgi:hypothetical protein
MRFAATSENPVLTSISLTFLGLQRIRNVLAGTTLLADGLEKGLES